MSASQMLLEPQVDAPLPDASQSPFIQPVRVCVVIPTFNEKDNIEGLIPQLRGISPSAVEVVVVDDNSSDGTAETVMRLSEKSGGVHLVQRPTKAGIGSAVQAGIRWALENTDCDIVVTMDGDWSHNPADLPTLVNAAIDADLVQGSRYINGGTVTGSSGYRRMLSRFGNGVCRILFRTGLREHTTYYRAYRRHCASAVTQSPRDDGYVFAIDSLLVALDANFRVKEVPIEFNERRNGHSKLRFRDGVAWMLTLGRLFASRLVGDLGLVTRFALVGFTGVLVNELLLWLMVEPFGLLYLLASPVAIEVSILWNFLLHDLWSFRQYRTPGRLRRLGRYQLVALTSLIVNFAALAGLVELFSVNYLIANLVGIVLAFGVNLTGSARWAWNAEDQQTPT